MRQAYKSIGLFFMIGISICVVIFIVVLLSFNVEAQEFRPRIKLPEGTTTADNQKCYTLEEYEQIILIASEYRGLHDWRLANQELLIHYDTLKSLYTTLNQVHQRQLKLYSDERDYYKLRLKQVNSEVRDHRLERGLLWGLVGVQAISIVILAIVPR